MFADGADKASMLEMYANPLIQGLTTNPTLMKKAGITDYRAFCKDILTHIKDRPLSFEVFSDEFEEMERQALEIASWGDNVYVKIPITNTRGESSVPLVKRLADQGRQGQRDRADDARPGARRRAGPQPGSARATCRCSPAASPTPAARPFRSWPRPSRCSRSRRRPS